MSVNYQYADVFGGNLINDIGRQALPPALMRRLEIDGLRNAQAAWNWDRPCPRRLEREKVQQIIERMLERISGHFGVRAVQDEEFIVPVKV